MRAWIKAPLIVVGGMLVLVGTVGSCSRDSTTDRSSTSTDPKTSSALRQQGPHGDGDSWKDTTGREYRMGLVNAPETNECFGSDATMTRRELLADGFRATVYTTDTHGRSVSEISTATGVNLNVWMARKGYVDDRYLARYRHERPELAAALDSAFAAAKQGRVGLWGACAGRSQ